LTLLYRTESVIIIKPGAGSPLVVVLTSFLFEQTTNYVTRNLKTEKRMKQAAEEEKVELFCRRRPTSSGLTRTAKTFLNFT
jgi:hypothetical protein